MRAKPCWSSTNGSGELWYRQGQAGCGPTFHQSAVYPVIHIIVGVLTPISLMIGWNLKIVNIAKVLVILMVM